MDEDSFHFKWADYVVFSLVLLLSAAIGFYYACTGGKQKTTKEYLLADRNMHWIPVAISLAVSYMSSSTLVGSPGEIYAFGTIYLYTVIGRPIAAVICVKFFIPVFKRVGSISVYEYVLQRFGKAMKAVAVIELLLFYLMYSSVVIYGPALSISAVTGVNLWLAVFSVGAIAMVYTVLGGLKAVLWTDTLQFLIMIVGCIVLLIFGTVKAGGPSEVWRVNKLSGRMDMLEPSKFLNFDPRVRHTLWTQIVNGISNSIAAYGTSPVAVQRVFALRPEASYLNLTYVALITISIGFEIICAVTGLVAFAYFKMCDPISAGDIASKDQLQPLLIMKLFGRFPGLPGLLLSSVFSASLSTISSVISSSAAIILNDFVKPCKPDISDKASAVISKIISVIFGVVAILFVVFLKFFGSGLLSMVLALMGITTGVNVTLFTIGVFFPFVDGRCALIGNIFGLAYAGWLSFGGLINRPYVYSYPVTTAGCNITDENLLGNISSPVYDPSTWNPQSHYRSGIDAMYDISYAWLGPGGVLISLIISLSTSLILRNKNPVNKKLLASCVVNGRFTPQYWKKFIDYREDGELNDVALKAVHDIEDTEISQDDL